MFRRTHWCWKAKNLQQMFRKLKLAGAHPDILWSIDAQKAQHNGEEMIRLETLMHEREKRSVLGSSGASSSYTSFRHSNAPEHFLFWIKSSHLNGNDTALHAVRCSITPLSSNQIVKRQLTELFEQAGVHEEFELGTEGGEMNLEHALRYADEQQNQHLYNASTLYIRGDKAVENLRRFGVLLVVLENSISYLVSLPETTASAQSEQPLYTNTRGVSAVHVPAKSIVGPNGEIDPDVQDFMTERGMRPFDLRMAGSHSSVERFVVAFERLERMYEVHRGRAMRPSVCLVLSLTSPDNFIAPDGCIVLSVQRMPSWEEYLLSLSQEVWMDCVQKHKDWRIGSAPKLQERKRHLARIADMFHVFRVTMEAPVGGRLHWQEELIQRFMKEETSIRRAVEKYNLKSNMLKKRGEISIVDHLYNTISDPNDTSQKEIGFRISGDGSLVFNQSVMNTGQMLRVFRDNLKRIEGFRQKHDDVLKALEHLSRHVPLDFSVDTEWKLRETNLVDCLDRFVRTIKQNESELAAFLNSLLQGNTWPPSASSSVSASVPLSSLPVKKRMVWVISDRYDTLPSGVVFIPYDVDFCSIKKLLLTVK